MENQIPDNAPVDSIRCSVCRALCKPADVFDSGGEFLCRECVNVRLGKDKPAPRETEPAQATNNGLVVIGWKYVLVPILVIAISVIIAVTHPPTKARIGLLITKGLKFVSTPRRDPEVKPVAHSVQGEKQSVQLKETQTPEETEPEPSSLKSEATFTLQIPESPKNVMEANTDSQEIITIQGGVACAFHGEEFKLGKYRVWAGDEADEIVGEILAYSGLPKNFSTRAGKVNNAAAVISNNKRFILFNPKFISEVQQRTRTDWSSRCILAHEIGHHLSGHTLTAVRRKEDELEADKFSGHALFKMGAKLVEAQAWVREMTPVNAMNGYPSQAARLQAIRDGWSDAQKQIETLTSPEFPFNKVACKHRIRCKHVRTLSREVPCQHPPLRIETKLPCTHHVACAHKLPCVHRVACKHLVTKTRDVPCVHRLPCQHLVFGNRSRGGRQKHAFDTHTHDIEKYTVQAHLFDLLHSFDFQHEFDTRHPHDISISYKKKHEFDSINTTSRLHDFDTVHDFDFSKVDPE
ncbi:MAG: hypothetical protein O2856_12215 [Planctomycetota bacterium]|nr:hypothetical protein [Planctomycetota bacterium]